MYLSSSKEVEEYGKFLQEHRDPNQKTISLCSGTGCQACGAKKIDSAIRSEIKKAGLEGKVRIIATGCHGFCEKGPVVVIRPQGVFYQKIALEDVPEIVRETILESRIVERLLYADPKTGEKIIREKDVPFYKKQMRIVSSLNPLIDPTCIDDYIYYGGYFALAKAVTMEPLAVLEEVKKANLRGRGGGGFPAGVKWETCRNADGDIRYVICNADEGDPGAFMDESILEGNPHSVIEGMIIGAYAIGSSEGYVYVRREYPLAVKRLEIALDQAKECGFLGENILGSGFHFNISVNKGGGAFVCGESTALMASIEGKVGEPRAKHIHTVKKGLWDRPSNLNNVETWANVPHIILKGADWFASIGTEKSKGTKLFSLVGKVENTGLVEVPMGITLREIIYDIGGGIRGGKRFKAVQTGGPSGGCIPASHLDLPVDFDKLYEVGSMIGSGGMIVMDEDTCMVDVAKFFLNFLKDESCGKCTTCRDGISAMLDIVTRITQGKGKEGDVELIEELAEMVRDASLCALGGSAPNPVLTTIRYMRDEYEVHIREKRCPAGVCKVLIRFRVDEEKCTGCHRCVKVCPQDAIEGEPKKPHIIIQDKCIKCGICRENCRFDAVLVE